MFCHWCENDFNYYYTASASMCLRHCVSQERTRYQEQGYDLDLAFITPRIIASGCPAFGLEQCFRNPHKKMENLFDEKFGDKYYVFNLCTEESRIYDDLFGGRVFNYPFPDHYAAPLQLVVQFVLQAYQILQDPSNAIVVHCKAGKGRTGVMVICLQLYQAVMLHQQVDFQQLITNFEQIRGRGLRLPCQIRLVGEFNQLLQFKDVDEFLLPQSQQTITQLAVRGFKNSKIKIKILCTKGNVNFKMAQKFAKFSVFNSPENGFAAKSYEISTEINKPVQCRFQIFGDCLIQVFKKKKIIGRVQFYVGLSQLEFRTDQIDKCKGIGQIQLIQATRTYE